MEKRERVVSLNTIGTLVSVIAAVVSAFFAFRANDLMERQTALMESQISADVILSEQSTAHIDAGKVCYKPATGKPGIDSIDVGYNVSYSMDAQLKLTNEGGKSITVLSMFLRDASSLPGGMEHIFFVSKLNDQSIAEALPQTLEPGITPVWNINAFGYVNLGYDPLEAQKSFDLEKSWSPGTLTLVLQVGSRNGTRELVVPVRSKSPMDQVVLDPQVLCGAS